MIPVGKEAFEKADEEENGVRKPAVKFSLKDSLPQNIKELSANLPYPLQHLYKGDYRLVVAGHSNGHVVATTKNKKSTATPGSIIANL